MGSAATVVERSRWNFRPLISWRGAVAGCGGKSAAPQSDGSRHDVFDGAEFLLRRWPVGHVLDGMDLGQHRPRHSDEKKFGRTQDLRRGGGRMDPGRAKDAEHSTFGPTGGTARGCSLLL